MEFIELFIYFFIPQIFVSSSCGSGTAVGAETWKGNKEI